MGNLIHLPIALMVTLIVLKDQLGSQTISASVLFPSHGVSLICILVKGWKAFA